MSLNSRYLLYAIAFCLKFHPEYLQFDQVCDSLYDVPWYLLKPCHRKTLNLFLFRAQNAELPTFGKMAPMNMATFVQVPDEIFLQLGYIMFSIPDLEEHLLVFDVYAKI